MYGFIACTFAVLLVAPALVAVSLQAAEQRSEAGRLATKPLRLPWGAERRFEQLASAKEPDSQELDGGSSDDPSSQTLGNAGTEMHESEKSLVTHAIGQLVGKVLGVFGVGGGGGDETEQKDKRLQQHQQQQKKQPRPDQKQQHPTDEERSNKASKERSSHVTEKDKEEDARAMAEAMARVRRERAKDVKHALAVAGMHKKQREQVAKQAEDAGEQVALEEKEKLERAQKQLERAKQQREAQRLERKERKEREAQQAKKEREMEKMHEKQEEEEKAALERAKRMKASMERAKQLRLQQQREREKAAKRRCVAERTRVQGIRVSMYCLSLMMPFGYEPTLLAEQHKQGVGIFACDETAVFSNSTVLLPEKTPSPVEVTLMPGSLAVTYGGRWGTAMNTGVFNRLWTKVVEIGDYRRYDWTVKVDPDAVFFPARLRNILRRRSPMNSISIQGEVPANMHCGQCQLQGRTHETCAARVQGYQIKKNFSCADALTAAARAPPQDCGCRCDDFACNVPEQTAMYINNCKWGLHGPIEVFSRRAVASYLAGLPQCVSLLRHPWGEDKFIDKCMQELGVTRVNEYDVLSETACGEQPAPCGGADVSFHPFKSIESYFACFGFASKFGRGPADFDCDSEMSLMTWM